MAKIDSLRNKFNNKDLFDRALTHKSWVNEHPLERRSNERLEYLGDAILEFVVSDELFTRFTDKEEGFMTALRANLVNTINLSVVARSINLGEHIFLSKGEEDGGGRDNPSLLADTVEAVIGAIFVDQGLEAAKKFIVQNVLSNIEQKLAQPLKDAKSRLQEKVQSNGSGAPSYKVVEESGPDHAKHFKVEVQVDGKRYGSGTGKSKSEAEQSAATNALEKTSNNR